MDMGLIKIWVELGFFQSAIHSFRLSIRPEMTAFRPAVLYVVLPADPIKGMTSVLFCHFYTIAALPCPVVLHNLAWRRPLLGGLCKLWTR